MNDFKEPGSSTAWGKLVDAACQAAVGLGFKMERVPKKGLANIWQMTKGGRTERVSIRTTRDRWFTFLPLGGGVNWKTLDEVEVVLVAALDRKHAPRVIEVYMFPADEVRKRFNAAYKARKEAKHKINETFGFWLALDRDTRPTATSVGSGLAEDFPPIAVYPISELRALAPEGGPGSAGAVGDNAQSEEWQPLTIAEAVDWARQQVARLAGVKTDAVKLDLKIEY